MLKLLYTQPFSEDSDTTWIACYACQNHIVCPASLLSKPIKYLIGSIGKTAYCYYLAIVYFLFYYENFVIFMCIKNVCDFFVSHNFITDTFLLSVF